MNDCNNSDNIFKTLVNLYDLFSFHNFTIDIVDTFRFSLMHFWNDCSNNSDFANLSSSWVISWEAAVRYFQYQSFLIFMNADRYFRRQEHDTIFLAHYYCQIGKRTVWFQTDYAFKKYKISIQKFYENIWMSW